MYVYKLYKYKLRQLICYFLLAISTAIFLNWIIWECQVQFERQNNFLLIFYLWSKRVQLHFKNSFKTTSPVHLNLDLESFFISKKNTSVGWSNRCNFFWNALDPTLVIFLTFFEKNYNDWIKSFYKSKWTGLKKGVKLQIDE